MGDVKHKNDQAVVVDFVNDPMLADTDAQLAVSLGQFFCTKWTGLNRERINLFSDAAFKVARQFSESPCCTA